MSKMRAKALWLLAAVAVLTVGVFIPAAAFDQSLKPITLSPEQRVSEQSFLPMAAPDPIGLYTVEECRTLNSCDTIPFNLDIPNKFIHLTILTLSFEHAGSANDLDMFVYENQQDEDGHDVLVGSAASQAMPEVFKVADIPGTTTRSGLEKDAPYWIVIVNFTGSTAYTLKGELRPQSSDFTVPSSGAAPRPRQIATEAPKPTVPRAAESSLPQVTQAEEDKLPTVKEAGADGELTDLPLVAIRGQAREQEAPNRTPLVIATIVLLALAGGTFAFFFIRSRRASEEAAA